MTRGVAKHHARGLDDVTLSKLECSKQAKALNIIAWDNTTGL